MSQPVQNEYFLGLDDISPHMPGPSVMRRFLEDPTNFSWPNHPKRRRGNYYQFTEDFPPENLLKLERYLNRPRRRPETLGAQAVRSYQIREEWQERMHFKESVAVKDLTRQSRTPDQANEEAELMKGLRHPHIAALLGTFYHCYVDCIVTFPVGCCDLGDFMACISQRLEGLKSPSEEDDLRHRETPRERELLAHYELPWQLTLKEQLKILQGFFQCLCQALAYLHNAHIRHKDIKPENIIIDRSLNVILVDFGISKQYASGKQMTTQDPLTPSTPKYMTPEMANNKERDDRSDVYLLGCVFLEMVSLLFGRSHGKFADQCRPLHPKTGTPMTEYYYKFLPKIYDWLDDLPLSEFRGPSNKNRVIAALPKIKQMLNSDKEQRQKAQDLWQDFNFAAHKCPDCDPTTGIGWVPSDFQRQTFEQGQEARKHAKDEQDHIEIRAVEQAITDEKDATKNIVAYLSPIQEKSKVPGTAFRRSDSFGARHKMHRPSSMSSASKAPTSDIRSSDKNKASNRASYPTGPRVPSPPKVSLVDNYETDRAKQSSPLSHASIRSVHFEDENSVSADGQRSQTPVDFDIPSRLPPDNPRMVLSGMPESPRAGPTSSEKPRTIDVVGLPTRGEPRSNPANDRYLVELKAAKYMWTLKVAPEGHSIKRSLSESFIDRTHCMFFRLPDRCRSIDIHASITFLGSFKIPAKSVKNFYYRVTNQSSTKSARYLCLYDWADEKPEYLILDPNSVKTAHPLHEKL